MALRAGPVRLARKPAKTLQTGAEQAKQGWDAVIAPLSDYAQKARDIGGDIGNALVGAFQSAENAVRGEFVKTGKLNFHDLVTSMLADMAKLGARRFLLGPLANVLSGALGGIGGGVLANVLHSGGMVGAGGTSRMAPAMAFANAPHAFRRLGGSALGRGAGDPAARRAGALARREVASGAVGVTININARDAESFRQSRAQIRGHCPRRRDGKEGDVMAFHEVRFPDNISRGARGGPERLADRGTGLGRRGKERQLGQLAPPL